MGVLGYILINSEKFSKPIEKPWIKYNYEHPKFWWFFEYIIF